MYKYIVRTHQIIISKCTLNTTWHFKLKTLHCVSAFGVSRPRQMLVPPYLMFVALRWLCCIIAFAVCLLVYRELCVLMVSAIYHFDFVFDGVLSIEPVCTLFSLCKRRLLFSFCSYAFSFASKQTNEINQCAPVVEDTSSVSLLNYWIIHFSFVFPSSGRCAFILIFQIKRTCYFPSTWLSMHDGLKRCHVCTVITIIYSVKFIALQSPHISVSLGFEMHAHSIIQ